MAQLRCDIMFSLQFNCFHSQLSNFGAWSDSYGKRQTYFAGANYGQKICQCGIKSPNQCFKLRNVEDINQCNCDQKDAVYRRDSGFITNMVNILNNNDYFYIEKWTFKVMYEAYFCAKQDRNEATCFYKTKSVHFECRMVLFYILII